MYKNPFSDKEISMVFFSCCNLNDFNCLNDLLLFCPLCLPCGLKYCGKRLDARLSSKSWNKREVSEMKQWNIDQFSHTWVGITTVMPHNWFLVNYHNSIQNRTQLYVITWQWKISVFEEHSCTKSSAYFTEYAAKQINIAQKKTPSN